MITVRDMARLITRLLGMDYTDGREPLSREIGSLPGWAVKIVRDDGVCPYCYNSILIGPQGGSSVDYLCSDALCGVRYRIATVEFANWGEVTDILRPGDYIRAFPLFRRLDFDWSRVRRETDR